VWQRKRGVEFVRGCTRELKRGGGRKIFLLVFVFVFVFVPLLRRNETAFRVCCARCSSRKQRVDDGDDSRRKRHRDDKRKAAATDDDDDDDDDDYAFYLCLCVCVFSFALRVFVFFYVCKSNARFLKCVFLGTMMGFFPSIVSSTSNTNTKTQKHENNLPSHTRTKQRRRRDDFIDYHIAIETIHALRVHLFLISRCSSHCFCHHYHHQHHHQHQDIRVSSPTHDFCLTPPSQ